MVTPTISMSGHIECLSIVSNTITGTYNFYAPSVTQRRETRESFHNHHQLKYLSSMLFLQNYWLYNQCYEIPRNYAVWSAFSVISAAVGRKVYIRQGDIVHRTILYNVLVGEQGGRKSVAKDFARDLFMECFPDIRLGAARQSVEDIVKLMASGELTRSYEDEQGRQIDFVQLPFFINELKNFLAWNPTGTIDFLTDIYDREYYDASTIKRGLEIIHRPCLNLLACETKDWIIEKLRGNIITGGISRRVNYIYERLDYTNGTTPIIPRPHITEQAAKAWKDVAVQLKRIAKYKGEFKWSKEGGKAFDEWYIANKKNLPSDPVLRGYRMTKDVQLLKIAMILALTEESPRLVLTPALIELALEHINEIEKNMPLLSAAAGRNELALPQLAILDYLHSQGGWTTEKQLLIATEKDVSSMEQYSIIEHLVRTGRVVKKDIVEKKVVRRALFLTEVYEDLVRKGEIKVADPKAKA